MRNSTGPSRRSNAPMKSEASRRTASTEMLSSPKVTSTPRNPRHSSSGTPTGPSKKWSTSSNSMNENGHNGHMTSHREPSYNTDDGSMRFYMRGRSLNFYSPSNIQDYEISNIGDAPSEKLKLDWVYGYRGRDARCNLYLLPTGEMVYFMAAVVILYNVEEQMQRHYLGHTDDVKCLAVHPDKITIATGQVAGHDKREGKPHIRIWNSVSLTTLKIIGLGDFDRAVACVAFSKADGGQYLSAVDEANEHVISLWDWQKSDKGQKITETKSSTEAVLGCEFHPCEKNIVVTYGKGQISFWNIDGGTLTRKMGIYERHEKPKFVTCIAFAENGDVLSGDSNGNLFVWGRGNNKVTLAVTSAHEGGIFSICIMKDGTFVTGGKDKKIVEWTSSYKRSGREYEIAEHFGSIRMLSQGRGSALLVGTTKNCILQGSLDLEFSPIVQGHMEELWGLATHPSQHQFVTCGYDKQLYMWDSLTHSLVWSKEFPDGCHSAGFHPDGNILVVGMTTPKWSVIDLSTRDIVVTHTDGNEQIEVVTFSPDGTHIALGSRDNFIYIYAVSEGGRKYNRVGRCSGHSSFVTHVDWSSDGQYLQSNSGDYEVLFWCATSCKQITSALSMRDVAWATHSCTLAFNVCGIWPEGADGTDVNACARSNNNNLLASADDFGKVTLFRYPCCQPKSTGLICGGHSSHVTNVKFMNDDTRLLSTGGKDMSIMQWEVIE
ncbi:hypothetical protein CAPTEDRAFT_152534 [Capitella teleta]|uniref:Uncharacterized protein n=1 Tax=Capitella teleta TaxID=283909 RepID=R7TJT9_CAPTE|nr:hypothetical protein CAPTEDRAFT_152534 [Capitella teleta]|eukprot:ELT93984.1 hypothetical protein CAPTEDRAFT_152534 [Capitella teleta]